MAEWAYKVFVPVGDAYGNPKRVAIGEVTVGRRTTLGFQANPEVERDNDLPDFTFDTQTGGDLIREIAHQMARFGGKS